MNKKIDLKALLETKMGEIEPAEDSREAIEGAEMSIPKNLMFDAESTEFKPETEPVAASGARGLTVEEAKTFNDEMSRFIRSSRYLILSTSWRTHPRLEYMVFLQGI